MAGPTDEEKPILDKFRNNISDLVLDEFEENDIFLLSWLRARELDIPKAEQMMRKSFEWRETIGYHKLNEWNPPEDYPTNFLFDVYSHDDDDCPVIIVPVGEWDIRKVTDKGEKDLFLRFISKMSLTITAQVKQRIKESGKYVSQFVAIFDMKGFSMRQLTSYSAVEAMLESVRQYEANFPETLKTAYVINAPRIFAILFNLIKPILSARTLSKVQIYDSNASKWKPILLNNIPKEHIPIFYGGTNTKQLYASFERELELENNLSDPTYGLLETIVAAGSQFKVEYFVDKMFTTINWKFKITNCNIGFCIKHENKKEVVQYRKYDNSREVQEGSLICEKLGRYVVLFDNTYSRLRSKTLNYIITIEDPD